MTLLPEVHWEEGMFLMPQHFQALARQLHERIDELARELRPLAWGVRSLELDEGRIEAFQVVIRHCEVMLPSGHALDVPHNADLAPRSFEPEFRAAGGHLTVLLGVPFHGAGSAIATSDQPMGRYNVVLEERADENVRAATRPLQVRYLNARLFFGGEDATGFETVPLFRLVPKNDVDAVPRVDSRFIPPLARIAAWPALMRQLAGVTDALRNTNNSLGRDLAGRPLELGGQKAEAVLKLQATNVLLASTESVLASGHTTPSGAYQALRTILGGLAMFGQDRSLPPIRPYDHLDLGAVFAPLVSAILALLEVTWRRSYEQRALVPDAENPQLRTCLFDHQWTGRDTRLFLAAEFPAGDDRLDVDALDHCVLHKLTVVGAPDLEMVRRTIVRGIVLQRVARTPGALPEMRRTYFYAFDREATDPERWRALDQANSLCVLRAGELPRGVTLRLFAIKDS